VTTVKSNHTLNSKSDCYVQITKEHLRCMVLSSNAPRRLWSFALQHFCGIFGWWPKANGIAPWKRVSSECQLTANLDRDLHAFGSYCIGHLSRESKLVENTTLDDRGQKDAFLMSEHSTPTFWIWSFKFNKPMKMCDGIFIPLTLFVALLSFSTPTKIFVLCTKPTTVLIKTISLFHNMTCVLTQRQCTTHPAKLHRLSAKGK